MKDNRKRVYFKEDILNLLIEKYYTLFVPLSVRSRNYRPWNYFKISLVLQLYQDQTNSKTVDPVKFHDFYVNAKETYDSGTWLKLALEYLKLVNIDTQEVLSTLYSEEMLKHGEEIEFVL
jgi:hypothetical protein